MRTERLEILKKAVRFSNSSEGKTTAGHLKRIADAIGDERFGMAPSVWIKFLEDAGINLRLLRMKSDPKFQDWSVVRAPHFLTGNPAPALVTGRDAGIRQVFLAFPQAGQWWLNKSFDLEVSEAEEGDLEKIIAALGDFPEHLVEWEDGKCRPKNG